MENNTKNNGIISNEILVRCRILSHDNEGNYSVLSKQSCKEIIEQEWGRRVAIDNCFVVTFDSEYSVFNLFNDLREKFNIPKLRDEQNENPDIVSMLMRTNDYLITIRDMTIKLDFLIERFQLKTIDAYLLFVFGYGELFREKGFRFHIYSHEGNKHNKPHVHVETSDYRTGSIDIQTLSQTSGKLKKHEVTRVRKILDGKQRELLEAWNLYSDGIDVDIDYLLGQTTIKDYE